MKYIKLLVVVLSVFMGAAIAKTFESTEQGAKLNLDSSREAIGTTTTVLTIKPGLLKIKKTISQDAGMLIMSNPNFTIDTIPTFVVKPVSKVALVANGNHLSWVDKNITLITKPVDSISNGRGTEVVGFLVNVKNKDYLIPVNQVYLPMQLRTGQPLTVKILVNGKVLCLYNAGASMHSFEFYKNSALSGVLLRFYIEGF